MNLYWKTTTAPAELHTILRTLAEEYPVRENTGDTLLEFEPLKNEPGRLRVTKQGNVCRIEYGSRNLAPRGVAWALAGQECDELCSFTTFGILFDCTRGNVMKVDSFKVWLRKIALMGYNTAMLYVKDMYQLPDEPYFGYMRGAYSLAEMKEVDSYARKLGIEMIASLQALGHMEPILRWRYYRSRVMDTDNVLLVDEPKTMELLEKMIGFWSEAFTSRRIHLGMDETHDLGRGKFMDKNGYESPFSLFNRHLARVLEICRKHQLKPIIWADMYFRYANKDQNYYDTHSQVPEEVKKAIPPEVQLSYWDYYHRKPDIYESMLKRTSALNGSAPFMASGVWTWARLWTDFEMTEATVAPCMEACRKVNAKEFLLTLWGDDGGYCNFPSCWAGLVWAADAACHENASQERAAQLFRVICHTDYDLQRKLGEMEYTYVREEPDGLEKISAACMLWDDPLMGLYWREFPIMGKDLPSKLLARYEELMAVAEPHREECEAGNVNHAWNVCNVLAQKVRLRMTLDRAYAKRDYSTLNTISGKYIPEILDAIEGLNDTFREQWLREFKPYGLELMQIRLAGLMERYRELARNIDDLVEGDIEVIDQLEEKHDPKGSVDSRYRMFATAGWYI